MPFDWDDLKVFAELSTSRSLGDAAQRLRLHRSTVLRRIERLEQQLGNRLVIRSHDGIALTAGAERMAEEAIAVLSDADIEHARPAGPVRVAASLNLCFGLLQPPIARFCDGFPEISVDLIATTDGFSPVATEHIDIAFRALEPGAKGHENMIGRRLGSLPVAVFGADGYFHRHGRPAGGGDLGAHRIVSLVENFAGLASMRWLDGLAGAPKPVYRASSMLLLLAAVREGIGLAILPVYLAAAEPSLSKAFDLAPETGADLWILRHPHLRQSARMRAFSEFMAAEIPALL